MSVALSESVATSTPRPTADGALMLCDIRMSFGGAEALCGVSLTIRPGEILAVHAAHPEQVRAALVGAPGVRSALLVGDRVHLFVDEATRRLPDLRGRLESAGIAFDSIQAVEASIEDLFVSAVESAPEAAGETKPS